MYKIERDNATDLSKWFMLICCKKLLAFFFFFLEGDNVSVFIYDYYELTITSTH